MKKGRNSKNTTIDDLAVMVAGGFKRVDEKFEHVDKKIEFVRSEIKGDIFELRNDIDVMLSRHLGTFRKDYDDLATRVKKLEEIVLQRK